MPSIVQQNEATAAQRRLFFVAVTSSDGVQPMTGLTITGSSGDLQISKNGAAFTNALGDVAVELSDGLYYYPARVDEFDTVGSLLVKFEKLNCRTVIFETQVVPWDPYDTVRQGMTALPNAAAEAAGGLFTRGTGAGQINQNANGQIDTRVVAASAASITSGALAPGAIAPLVLAAGSILSGTIGPSAITDTNTAQSARWAQQQIVLSGSIEGAFSLFEVMQWLGSMIAGDAQVPSGSGDFRFLGMDGSTVRVSGTITAAGARSIVSRS